MAARFPETPESPFDTFRSLVLIEKLFEPQAIAIDSSTNEIYVTDESYLIYGDRMNRSAVKTRVEARIYVYTEKGELVKYFTHEDLKYPYGIAIHRDNIYVTDVEQDCLFHFKVSMENRFIAQLGGLGSGIGEFNEPRQLTVSSNGDVYLTDYLNHRIPILDSDLCYKRTITHHSLRYPCDIKLTLEQVCVLCDGFVSPSIHTFSHIGENIRSMTLPENMIQSSYFFCINVDGNFILSDCADHQIKLFSKDGVLLDTFGRYGLYAGDFYKPRGLAFTNNHKLVIAFNNSNFGLQIFSI